MQAGLIGAGSRVPTSISHPLTQESENSLPPLAIVRRLFVEEYPPQPEEEEGGRGGDVGIGMRHVSSKWHLKQKWPQQCSDKRAMAHELELCQCH